MRCLPCLGKIAETALKGGPVGNHRETCRPPRFKGAGERGRVEIGADQPFRGARLFDFRDQSHMAGLALGLDRLDEAARRILVMRLARQGLERHAHLRRRALAPPPPPPCERGEARFETGTSLASVSAARPSSSAPAAKAAPCFKSP